MKKASTSLRAAYTSMQENSGLKAGDRVKVLREAQDYELGWPNVWDKSEMHLSIGKTLTIVSLSYGGVALSDGFSYPVYVLEKVKTPFKPIRYALNDNHTAVVHKDCVKVGCQSFTQKAILDLAKIVQHVQSLK